MKTVSLTEEMALVPVLEESPQPGCWAKPHRSEQSSQQARRIKQKILQKLRTIESGGGGAR